MIIPEYIPVNDVIMALLIAITLVGGRVRHVNEAEHVRSICARVCHQRLGQAV